MFKFSETAFFSRILKLQKINIYLDIRLPSYCCPSSICNLKNAFLPILHFAAIMLSVILQFGCIAWLAIGRKGIEFNMCIGNLWRKADNANFNRLGGKESLSKPDSLKKILLLLFLVHVLPKSKSSSIMFPENLVSGLISDLRGKTKGGRQTER